ncbi:MAG: hypothetical protein AB2A00_31180, partial [Myxococcota bacterium]
IPGLSTSSSGGGQEITALAVDPASMQVDANWGTPVQRTLRALATRANGSTEEVQAQWSTNKPVIARVDSTGKVTITAQRAGQVVITAELEGKQATCTIDVRVFGERVLPGAPPSAPVDFSAVSCTPDNTRQPRIVYPVDNVVLPLNLPSPLIQWVAQVPASLYRVKVAGDHGSMSLYTTSDRAQVPEDLWAVLLAAHAGGLMSISVEAIVDTNLCVRSGNITMKLANADLSAAVYYWAVNVGQILRIDVGSTSRQRLNIEPASNDGNRCNACHVLSRDGQKLAFTYYGGDGPGGVVPTGSPETPFFSPQEDKRWNYATFDPTGNLLLTNFQKQLTLRNANDGVSLSTLPFTGVAMPTWSPDGAQVAFAANIQNADGSDAQWEIDFDRSDLQVVDVNAATQNFGTPATLVQGGGDALSYPSYSADGKYLIYQRGPHSRSRHNEQNLVGQLELVLVEGGAPVTLVKANPDGNSYMPTFSPFVEGGYQWVAFYSRRDYGLVLQGLERPQIWVAAIEENPVAGQDPSHPAFWLPGQDEGTENLSSYFADVPCRDPGGSCTTDVQCCNGQLCRPSANGGNVCTPPDQACSLAGEECNGNEDCCPGAGTCLISGEGSGHCSTGGQECRQGGQTCSGDGDCCPGAGTCRNNGSGEMLCTPGATGCRQMGETCSTDADCCEGQGYCIDKVCAEIPG